jgi:fructoselysine-6-P-deglycase FrlB-like protein
MSKKLTLAEIKAEDRRNYADWAGWQERENARAAEAARRERRVEILTWAFGTPLLLAAFAAAVVMAAAM